MEQETTNTNETFKIEVDTSNEFYQEIQKAKLIREAINECEMNYEEAISNFRESTYQIRRAFVELSWIIPMIMLTLLNFIYIELDWLNIVNFGTMIWAIVYFFINCYSIFQNKKNRNRFRKQATDNLEKIEELLNK
jgi:hypothetical protein